MVYFYTVLTVPLYTVTCIQILLSKFPPLHKITTKPPLPKPDQMTQAGGIHMDSDADRLRRRRSAYCQLMLESTLTRTIWHNEMWMCRLTLTVQLVVHSVDNSLGLE